MHQCFPERFRWLVGNVEVVGAWLSVLILLGRRGGVAMLVGGSQQRCFRELDAIVVAGYV